MRKEYSIDQGDGIREKIMHSEVMGTPKASLIRNGSNVFVGSSYYHQEVDCAYRFKAHCYLGSGGNGFFTHLVNCTGLDLLLYIHRVQRRCASGRVIVGKEGRC